MQTCIWGFFLGCLLLSFPGDVFVLNYTDEWHHRLHLYMPVIIVYIFNILSGKSQLVVYLNVLSVDYVDSTVWASHNFDLIKTVVIILLLK